MGQVRPSSEFLHTDGRLSFRESIYGFFNNKTKQKHQFPNFTPAWNSKCFGQSPCPSSGVYCLYTRHWRQLSSRTRIVKPVWHIPVPSV